MRKRQDARLTPGFRWLTQRKKIAFGTAAKVDLIIEPPDKVTRSGGMQDHHSEPEDPFLGIRRQSGWWKTFHLPAEPDHRFHGDVRNGFTLILDASFRLVDVLLMLPTEKKTLSEEQTVCKIMMK